MGERKCIRIVLNRKEENFMKGNKFIKLKIDKT